eukprot:scaffold93409_cov17-Tisochrysis_lutea.AAC.1
MYTVFSGIGTEADAGRTAEQTKFFLKEGRPDSSSNLARRGLAWVFIMIQPLIFRFMMVMIPSFRIGEHGPCVATNLWLMYSFITVTMRRALVPRPLVRFWTMCLFLVSSYGAKVWMHGAPKDHMEC